ncbi:alpha-ketoglutarate-dependent dioxygenase AlkB family protein [Robertkochia solimangrovi]|uniref:alpha-ketoglutarate-dependent dioxygenase AlkB family protein n=1 Tax=Robertkochia solimangrovi TaxID=2213046 RepID=UPI00117F8CC7|nr:alpha-ketoglutarate-dependent dioxygenase AlkB [Robertkochia solimangrovi]TRZ41785.1 alpha-ketoglutarate-dependent dioxygenase AlkB [Robertkochia solimangrovi]
METKKQLQNYLLPLQDAEIYYVPDFFNLSEAATIFRALLSDISWKQDSIRLFGKMIPQPRLTALYAENNHPYTYSGLTMIPLPYTELLYEISQKVAAFTGIRFSSCLLNLYRDGMDSNGWHADDEKELGVNPVIASLSFGEIRSFQFKHRAKKEQTFKIALEPGSLLLMAGATQHNWKHQLPKSKRIKNPRINLTYRVIHHKS